MKTNKQHPLSATAFNHQKKLLSSPYMLGSISGTRLYFGAKQEKKIHPHGVCILIEMRQEK